EAAHREQEEIIAPPDPVGQIGADDVADERPDDDHQQVLAGIEDRELAYRLQIGRQPGRDGVVAARAPVVSSDASTILPISSGSKMARTCGRAAPAAICFCVSLNTAGSSTKWRTNRTSPAGRMPAKNSARQAVSSGSRLNSTA